MSEYSVIPKKWCFVKSLKQVRRYFSTSCRIQFRFLNSHMKTKRCHLPASMDFLPITPNNWMLIRICFLFQSQLNQYLRGCLSNISSDELEMSSDWTKLLQSWLNIRPRAMKEHLSFSFCKLIVTSSSFILKKIILKF